MTDFQLRTRFLTSYAPEVRRFAVETTVTDAGALQEPHLPLWGKDYAAASMRLAFIGRDTRGWGEMTPFLAQAREDSLAACLRNMGEFRSLAFSAWTNRPGTSFWDTVFRILARAHGVQDWRKLRNRERDDILRSFLWAETNSMEHWNPKSLPMWEGRTKKKADVDIWRALKPISERRFDRISTLLDVFSPHVVVILNWNVPMHFWDRALIWSFTWHHLRHAVDPASGAEIIHTAHPGWLGRKRGRLDEMVSLVYDRLPRMQRW